MHREQSKIVRQIFIALGLIASLIILVIIVLGRALKRAKVKKSPDIQTSIVTHFPIVAIEGNNQSESKSEIPASVKLRTNPLFLISISIVFIAIVFGFFYNEYQNNKYRAKEDTYFARVKDNLFIADISLQISDNTILFELEKVVPDVYFSYEDPSQSKYKAVCIKYLSFFRSISVIQRTFTYESEVENYVELPNRMCTFSEAPLPLHSIFYYTPSITREYSIISHNVYVYPYDDIAHWNRIKFFDENKEEIPVSRNYIVRSTDWRLVKAELDEKEGSVAITLRRQVIYQLLTPLLILIVVIFIVLTQLIDEMGAFAEVSVALVISIWGVRQILVPSEIRSTIALDVVFLVLYLLLGVSMLLRLLLQKMRSTTSG